MSAAWFACEEPERPTDPWVLWHYAGPLADLPRWPADPAASRDCIAGLADGGTGCRGCQIKAQALAAQHPDDPHVAWLLQAVSATEGQAP